MTSQFIRVLVGAVILLFGLTYAVPYLFPQEQPGDDPGPRKIEESAPAKPRPAEGEQAGRPADIDEYDAMDESGYGYGALLADDEGAPPAAADDPDGVRTGVVVGAESAPRKDAFVENPTAMGNTPAEAARIQAGAEAEKKARLEEENRLKAEALARAEAEKKARLEEENRLKAEAAAKAEAEKKARLEEENRLKAAALAKAEAEKKARLEEERLLKAAAPAAGQAAAPAPAAPRTGGTDAAAAGRYLQVGSFSTLELANQVRDRLKGARIAVPAALAKHVGRGFGYKVIPGNAGNFTLLVGPATDDAVLRAVKPKIDAAVGVKSFIVSK